MNAATDTAAVLHLLRDLAPQVLGAVMRRYGDFAASEDAVQEALIAAAAEWPSTGIPDNPRGWLVRVASRRMTDHLRSEGARRRREDIVVSWVPAEVQLELAAEATDPGADDTLSLLFMCCHPALSTASAIALTLRALGGLSTAQIANAFLVPEATMAQRISRAKQTIKASGVPFSLPDVQERSDRLGTVLHVLYLIFSEGYSSSTGADLQRLDLAEESIRLIRMVHGLLPEVAEVAGLLALMLLTHARRHARTGPQGQLIPLPEQNRSLWDRGAIEEGVALLTKTLPRGDAGPYQVQAAIAAVHDEAARVEDTDWPQILALYEVLMHMSAADNPMVALSHAVAAAMVHGPERGLVLLEGLASDDRVSQHHRLFSVRAHLHERAGDRAEASADYRRAADRTTNTAEREYLLTQAARLADADN